MPPAPSPILEHKLTGQEVPRQLPPIWLEEIQNNKIFNKQRHKFQETDPARSVSAVIEQRKEEDTEDPSIKENSKTESDQEETEDLC